MMTTTLKKITKGLEPMFAKQMKIYTPYVVELPKKDGKFIVAIGQRNGNKTSLLKTYDIATRQSTWVEIPFPPKALNMRLATTEDMRLLAPNLRKTSK